MDRDQVTRRDFPAEGGGYDRASVDAHLVAVDALIAAAEAEVAALKVERESGSGAGSGPGTETGSGTESASDSAESAASPGAAPESDDRSGPASEATGRPEAGGGDDEVSARLVATKMAMDGADRNSIRERLEHDYELSDTDGLIDDLFERLG